MRTYVRKMRNECGWSINRLAREAGLSPSLIHYIETKEDANPGVFTLQKIASAMGTTVGVLITADGDSGERGMFLSDDHEMRYKALVDKDSTAKSDFERRSLFYILASDPELYARSGLVYDFRERGMLGKALVELPISSSGKSLAELGYNLFSGGTEYWDGEAIQKICCDPMTVIESLDPARLSVAINAMRIRKGCTV